MAWIKIDESCSDHPKIQQVGPLGLALFLRSITYCNRNLTDGTIPTRQATSDAFWSTGGGLGDPTALIASMVKAGLWEEVEGGYKVHHYLDYQFSKQTTIERREAKAMAGLKGANGRWHGKPMASAMANGMAESCPVPVPVPVPVAVAVAQYPYPDSVPEPKKRKTKTCPVEPDGFQEFYDEYPRKEARKNAGVSFGRLSISDRGLALEGVRRAKATAWAGKDVEFIPMPATYLNQRRWEDSIQVGVGGFRRGKGAVLMELGRRMKEEEARNGQG